MLKTFDIRSMFLNYFQKNGHRIMPSSSLVPQNDKTLLFTNAGMVQFKDVFVGLEKRDYKRATTSQKCVRAGGKHNDLDQVGFTARHHTFFEMLGNFSLGDYFKAEAIEFAWNFLTKELCLEKSKLLATVYHTDDEAREIWKKVAGSDFRIIPISTNDNFWAMGDIGPCGPCSEIFYDHGPEIFGDVPGSKDENGDRYVEIWNIVFMQFEQLANGTRTELKAKSIDTGMGLERIAAVMQGKCDNYDIDLFQSIMKNIEDVSHVEMNASNRASFKVIADHLRSLSFLISDGVFPSNEGRGYVLRRILRRAVRHANMLGVKDCFIYKLVPCLVNVMGDAYPELKVMKDTIISTINMEEEKFIATLDKGLFMLNNAIENIPTGGVLSGDAAFKLYDTYGFPLDLTQDILRSKNITVDAAGFDAAMKEQRNRANWKNSSYNKGNDKIFFDIRNEVKSQEFVGYDSLESSAKIEAIVIDGMQVKSFSDGKASIVFDKTPFYAECGGQVGDTGMMKKPLGSVVIENTRKVGDLIIHDGYVEHGTFSVGENVTLSVCKDARKNTTAHHTATHLLQVALRRVLGAHIAQKGSYVCKDYLRFDFSHGSAMTSKQISDVEKLVNSYILSNYPVVKKVMDKDEAIKSGATALFGEKYEQSVRVIIVVDEQNNVISSELCGGTHVEHTGEIGLFKILSESSIGSGLRRIEAVAGMALFNYLDKVRTSLDSVNNVLKATDADVIQKLSAVIEENKTLSSSLVKVKADHAIETSSDEVSNGIHLRICKLSDVQSKDLKVIANKILAQYEKSVVIIYDITNERVNVSVSSTVGYAKEILFAALRAMNGNGGGNNDFAQGGSTNTASVATSINEVTSFFKTM